MSYDYNKIEEDNLVVLEIDGVSHTFVAKIEKDEYDRDKCMLYAVKTHGEIKAVEVKVFKSAIPIPNE